MKVMVTGATGFVGRHVVEHLLASGHDVVAVSRDLKQAKKMPWFGKIKFIECDVHKDFSTLAGAENFPDVLIHLAWPGLPNYRDFFHISKNLPGDLAFLEAMVSNGLQHLQVAGTCLEYGMQHGPLTEDLATCPTTPYGFAKDTLRRSLQLLQQKVHFNFQWIRLFYMYGEGQNSNSLLAKLDTAISEGQNVFNMSAGYQLRDYLPIEKVAENFLMMLENPNIQGVINCCSGNPISVLDLVLKRCREKSSNIELNRGYYPLPDYEPLAFWGVSAKRSVSTTLTLIK